MFSNSTNSSGNKYSSVDDMSVNGAESSTSAIDPADESSPKKRRRRKPKSATQNIETDKLSSKNKNASTSTPVKSKKRNQSTKLKRKVRRHVASIKAEAIAQDQWPAALSLYRTVLVEEFMREWRFLADVLAGRSEARADFTDKLLSHVKKLADYSNDVIGSHGMSHQAVSGAAIKIFELIIDYASDKQSKHGLSLDYKFSDDELRVLVDAVAIEACRRYQFIILTQLGDDPLQSVIPFAKCGVERMLEYILRQRKSLTIEGLCDGLIAGHSGAYVMGYTNTQLQPRASISDETKSKSAYRKVQSWLIGGNYTAEGVYGRSGFMTGSNALYVQPDKRKTRHRLEWDKKFKDKSFPKKVWLGGKETFFNYGYTKMSSELADDTLTVAPKYGYCYVTPSDIDKWYGHLTETSAKVKPSDTSRLPDPMKRDLEEFHYSIFAFNRDDLENYLQARVEKPKLRLDQYLSSTYPQAAKAQYYLFQPRTASRKDREGRAEERDFRELNLEGAILRRAIFRQCQFGGSLRNTDFRGSRLIACNWQAVTSARYVQLKDTQLTHLVADTLDMGKSDLSQCDCRYSTIGKLKLTQATIVGLNLASAKVGGHR